MKNRSNLIVLGVASAVLVAVVIGWFIFNSNSSNTDNIQGGSNQTIPSDGSTGISTQQLAENNGQNGKPCWVAVDGTVYEISGFAQWVDGMHTPSGGKARCGKDLSSAINESPHGKSKLRLLKEIGQLQ